MKTGGGAFATVYRMRQDALERWVAVKIIQERDTHKRKKLLREASVQARLSIPCIPQVYDAFEQGANVYIIMEWIKGVSLAQLLDQSELSDKHRVWLADGVVRAVATLHGLGYAHRDLKPANILVSPRDGVYLVDFGFTKDISDGEKSVAGLVKGTPAYMAPELWRLSSDKDYFRADIFAAGRILRDILYEHRLSSITDDMLKDNPSLRPADGMEVLKKWESALSHRMEPAWAAVAGEPTTQKHVDDLYEASTALLAEGQIDEAYKLLLECLEEDPNMKPAMDLMARFPDFTRRRKYKKQLRLSIGAALVTALTLTSFLIGRITKDVPLTAVDGMSETLKQTLQLKASRSSLSTATFDFRQDSIQTTTLSGRLFVLNHPQDGFLVVDDVARRDMEKIKKGLVLEYGDHTVEWQNEDGKRVWRERMRILPFQTRSIVIRSHEKSTDGPKG